MLRKIKKNGTLGLIAPAFPANETKLDKGITYLKSLGYTIKEGQSVRERWGYFAGTDEMRIHDLHDMYADDEIDAIICARGGWGTLRLLDRVDYTLISRDPKALIGYSDITTLQLAIFHKSGIPSISGPMVAVEMGAGILDFTEHHFFNFINNTQKTYTIDYKDAESVVWHPGKAEGKILGGCLSMVAHQLGTPFSPDYTGSIMFLEDIDESPYKVDRYLAQMRQAGLFDNLNGLILGEFIECEDDNEQRASFTIEEVLHDYFDGVSYPVVYNFPYGHGSRKVSMPIGVYSYWNTGTQTIELHNPFVL
ncbi:MAG: LD-carboxypeptidase [Caldithrix sp.]|nr:LD-carboxypeptidase [Caldithrix sp.]